MPRLLKSLGARVVADREVLMITGRPGTRKSSSILDLAKTYPEVNVVCIDPDAGIPKLVTHQYGGWEALPNLAYFPVTDWSQVVEAHGAVRNELSPGDWYCFDMVGNLWKMAYENYIAEMLGTTPAEYMLDLKKRGLSTGFGGLSGDDWQLIKLQYYSVVQTALKRMPANVLVTAAMDKVAMKQEKATGNWVPVYPGQEAHWIRIGYSPIAEKTLESEVDTILHLTSDTRTTGRGQTAITWHMQTVGKDRGRTPVDADFTNLWVDYCLATERDPSTSPGYSSGVVGGGG